MAAKPKKKKAPKAKPKAPRVKLPEAQAKEARKMLRTIRDWYDEAKGKKGTQRKLVF
jgi:hypothetical protein